jgi:hypothetical protein
MHTMKKSLFFMAAFLRSHCAKITWAEVAPGVWKGIVGKPEAYDLLTASGSKPNTKLWVKSRNQVSLLQMNAMAGSITDGKTSLRFPLEKEEQLYGFG